MRLTCEIAAKYFIPAIRAMIAMKLVRDHGFTQVEAAKRLNTTQPAISYYLRSLRGSKAIEALKKYPDIMSLIDKMVKLIIERYDEKELCKLMCETCRRIREKTELISMFSE